MPKRIFAFVGMLAASWCVMTFTHELGHLLGGWLGGGTLRQVELLPWRLPYSMFDPDSRPLFTLWCGPLFGVVVSVAAARLIGRSPAWFIAHFCTLANGAYLASAWLSGDRFLDTSRLLAHGAHPATIAVYCSLTIGSGYVGFRRQCLAVLAAPISSAASMASSGDRDSRNET